jgi:hypothetical protein
LSIGSSPDREELAQGLLRAHERPVTWCILDWASEATAALTELLVANWGPGLCYQPGMPWADAERPAVLPRAAGSRLLRAAKARVWSSESTVPERQRVMESLEHGCLPLQFRPYGRIDFDDGFSEATRALVLHPDAAGSLAPLTDEELRSRIEVLAEALASGQLERDLSDRNG